MVPHQQAFEEFDSEASSHGLELFGDFGDEFEFFFSHVVVVLPEVVIVLADLFLHEGAIGNSSLVGISPHPQQGELLLYVLREVHVFLSVLMRSHLGEIGIDCFIGVGLACALLSGGDCDKQEGKDA